MLSPESLRESGYFDPRLVARARRARVSLPRIDARQLGLDMNLTSVIATQLWHHTYCGGGLCDLPTWAPPASLTGGGSHLHGPALADLPVAAHAG